MAYHHFIEPEYHCVFIRHYGDLGIHEFEEQVAELVTLPTYEKGMNLLRDISPTKLPAEYDLAYIKNNIAPRIKAQDEALGLDRMVAWVVSNPQDFKTLHQFCAIGRLNLRVANRQPFRDIERALQWLGIPEDYEIKYPDPIHEI